MASTYPTSTEDKEMTDEINNIEELLEDFGCDLPYCFGRQLYKYTDCGPWTTFLIREPVNETKIRFTVSHFLRNTTEKRLTGLQIKVSGQQKQDNSPAFEKAVREIVRFLGFTEIDDPLSTVNEKVWFRPQKEDGATKNHKTSQVMFAYIGLLEKYVKDVADGHRKPRYDLKWGNAYTGGPLSITVSGDLPALEEEIYYEDTITRVANWKDFFVGKCYGIKIGSIVEGSDVEIEGRVLEFPFTMDDLDRVVKEVNEEAAFYWERDNRINLIIIPPDGGAMNPPSDTNNTIYAYLEAFDDVVRCSDTGSPVEGLPEEVLEWINEQGLNEDSPQVDIKGWYVQAYCNDATY